MNPADPISLTAAIVAAVIGAAIILAGTVRVGLELRRRRRLLATTADLDGLEDDVLRYVRRVHLLRADWSARIPPDATSEVDTLYDDMLALARDLQERRRNGDDVTAAVAKLIRMEDEMADTIERAVR